MNSVSVRLTTAKGFVVIPTKAKIVSGSRPDVDPVDTRLGGNAIGSALKEHFLRPRDGFPKPVMLKPGKVGRCSRFHRDQIFPYRDRVIADAWENSADSSRQPKPDLTQTAFRSLDNAIVAQIGQIQTNEEE